MYKLLAHFAECSMFCVVCVWVLQLPGNLGEWVLRLAPRCKVGQTATFGSTSPFVWSLSHLTHTAMDLHSACKYPWCDDCLVIWCPLSYIPPWLWIMLLTAAKSTVYPFTSTCTNIIVLLNWLHFVVLPLKQEGAVVWGIERNRRFPPEYHCVPTSWMSWVHSAWVHPKRWRVSF